MLILCMSSPLFHLLQPLNRSAPISEIRKILSEYPDVLSSVGFSACTPKHEVFHDLPTFPGPLVFAKAHCLDPGKLLPNLNMEKAGIV